MLWKLWVLLSVAILLDVITSYLSVASGNIEVNPYNPIFKIMLMGGLFMLDYLSFRKKNNSMQKVTKDIMIVFSIMFLTASFWNLSITNVKAIEIQELETVCDNNLLPNCYSMINIVGFSNYAINNSALQYNSLQINPMKIAVASIDLVSKNVTINVSGSLNRFGSYKWNFTYEKFVLDPWWNTTFSYKKLVNVTGAIANYQLSMYLSYNTDYKTADCSDIRFANSSENEELDYWIENYTATGCWVWVEMRQADNFYLYYGNTTRVSTSSNGVNTFPLFEDCDDVSEWNWTANTYLQSNSTITYDGSTCKFYKSTGQNPYRTFTNYSKYFVYAKFRWPDSINGGFEYANNNSGGANCYTVMFHDTTNKLSYYDTAYRDFLNVTATNWYEVKTYLNGTTRGRTWVGLDDRNWTTYDNVTQIAPSGTPANYDRLSMYSAGVDITFFDNIFITNANFPDAEPSYELEGEEEQVYANWYDNKTSIGYSGYPSYFNITWNITSGTISTVLVQIDNVNYTAFLVTGSIYSYNTSLVYGSHNWTSYTNSSVGLWSKSDTWLFTVTRPAISTSNMIIASVMAQEIETTYPTVQYCTDNNTLYVKKNISFSLESNQSVIITEEYRPCVYGCDNVTLACSPDPFMLGLYFLIGFFGFLLTIGVLIVLYRRFRY